MTYITDTRAGEIRGELCEKHGAQWLHHYHRAIEAEVIRNLPKLKKPAVPTSFKTAFGVLAFALALSVLGPALDTADRAAPEVNPCPENGGWEYLGNGKYQCYTKRGKKTVQVQL